MENRKIEGKNEDITQKQRDKKQKRKSEDESGMSTIRIVGVPKRANRENKE